MTASDHRSFDAAEISLAIAGDREAVSAIARAFLPRVYGLCFRLVRRRDVAEEATQESFVRALRALPRLREPDRLPQWILAIAANTARELLRKAPREASLEEDPPTRDRTGSDEERRARSRALESAVAGLEPDDRALFLLHTSEGVPLDDLAREKHMTAAAMKSKIHRIRARVRAAALAVLERGGDA